MEKYERWVCFRKVRTYRFRILMNCLWSSEIRILYETRTPLDFNTGMFRREKAKSQRLRTKEILSPNDQTSCNGEIQEMGML